MTSSPSQVYFSELSKRLVNNSFVRLFPLASTPSAMNNILPSSTQLIGAIMTSPAVLDSDREVPAISGLLAATEEPPVRTDNNNLSVGTLADEKN